MRRRSWGPAVAVLAAITIIVGNVGALGQSSLKRMLAYSSVAQAGYMLAGVVVASRLGVQATMFYLAVYLFMNMAAFAVIVARERETDLGDTLGAMQRPRPRAPVARLADDDLHARSRGHSRDGRIRREVLPDRRERDRRLHVAGSRDRGRIDDLTRLLPAGHRGDVDARSAGRGGADRGVRARGPSGACGRLARAGCRAGRRGRHEPRQRAGRQPAATHPQPEVVLVALLAGAATIFFGIIPEPLFDLVRHAGGALTGLF